MMTWNTARLSLIAVVASVGFAAPSSAAALDPEVNYDPGTLSGKEYVIPLAGGRSDGAGTTDQVRGGAVAFGIGIGPPGGGRGSARSGDAPGGAGGSGRSGQSGRAGSSASGRGGGGSERGDPSAGQGGGASHAGDLRTRISDAEDVGGTGGRTLLILLAVLLPAAV